MTKINVTALKCFFGLVTVLPEHVTYGLTSFSTGMFSVITDLSQFEDMCVSSLVDVYSGNTVSANYRNQRPC